MEQQPPPSRSDTLYGTARQMSWSKERQSVPSKDCQKKKSKKNAADKFKQFWGRFSCCRNDGQKESKICDQSSLNFCQEPCSSNDKEKEEKMTDQSSSTFSQESTQDHENDKLFLHLIPRTGRLCNEDTTRYINHVLTKAEEVVARDINVTFREGNPNADNILNEETPEKQRIHNTDILNAPQDRQKWTSQGSHAHQYIASHTRGCHHIARSFSVISGDSGTVTDNSENMKASLKRKEIFRPSISDDEWSEENTKCHEILPDSESEISHANPGVHHSAISEVKERLHQMSEEMSADDDVPKQTYLYKCDRLKTGERNGQKSFLQSLFGFRNFQRRPVLVKTRMVNETNFCHPRYATLEARRRTLEDCTDPQLRGYDFEELARVGWYFNRRALITFCCGMEMPVTPNGHPLDVHLGLSPQCDFAKSVAKFPSSGGSEAGAARREEPSAGQEASGGEFHFSIPVQATEDVSAGHGVEFLAYSVTDTVPSFQESGPGEHISSEGDYYALPARGPSTGAPSSTDSLVTNRTPLASEVFQPFAGNPSPAPQRPAGTMQHAFESNGRLFMRGGGQGPFGTARLMRDLETDRGRQSPTQLPPADQINLYGERENYRARYPQYGFPSIRIWSFHDGWPTENGQSPSMLSDAGFFYAGYGDSVLCYSCGIGIRHWLPMDDPWIEHARWRPSCEFVRTLQGQEFIDAAVELTRNNRLPSYQEVRIAANRRRAGDADADESPQAADLGVDDETGLLCKVCYAVEMDTVLMPCRHLAVCQRCSARVGTCPICRTRIESTFRANFG